MQKLTSQLNKSNDEAKTDFRTELERLKAEAQIGIQQREEAIKKRDELLTKLKSDKKLAQEQAAQLTSSLEALQRESKLGEELLVTQMRELRQEREQLKIKFDYE